MINFLRTAGKLAMATLLLAGVSVTADAQWRQEMGTFRIGLLADPGTDRNVAGLSEIRRAYELALGMPVTIFVAKDYPALIDAHATSRIDYAVYSATAYATAQRLCSCVEPIAARQGPGRDLGIRAVLMMRKSEVAQSESLDGVKVAVAQGDSIAGSILPAMALSGQEDAHGIASEQMKIVDADSDAIEMYLNGTVDGLFGWALSGASANLSTDSGTFAVLVARGADADDLEVRWMSDLLRYGPHSVRSNLDKEAKDILADFLTGLHDNKPDVLELLTGSEDARFTVVGTDDYRLATEIVTRLEGK